MNLSDVWHKLVQSDTTDDREMQSLVDKLKRTDSNWMEFLRVKLHTQEMPIAFSIFRYLSDTELMRFFDTIVYYACFNHNVTQFAKRIILKLPRIWVIENIERYTEPILTNGDEDEYRRTLELYFEIDQGLTQALISRALASKDTSIREAGEDFQRMIKRKERE